MSINLIFRRVASVFLLSAAFICHAEIRNEYAEAQREIQKATNRIPKFTADDFYNIKDAVAINRRVSDADLANQVVPNEVQKRELLKLARGYRDLSREISNVQLKYANDERYRNIKDILRQEAEATAEHGNNIHNFITDAVKNGSTFGEINKRDKINKEANAEKVARMQSARDGFFATFSALENRYIELNGCIGQLVKKNSETYSGYPDTIYIKIKNDEPCRKFKEIDTTAAVINEFLGDSKPLSINLKEAENYRYDIELSCSSGSKTILGGLLTFRVDVQRDGRSQIPECVQGMGNFDRNYVNLVNHYKKEKEAQAAREAAKEQAIRNAEHQQLVQRNRNLASNDPVARALNYASGVPEDASGPLFFFPLDTSNGRCLYQAQADNSGVGQFAQTMMGAFASMAPILGAAGVQMPDTSTKIDLTKADFTSISFYRVNGTTQSTRNTNGTAYLKYQSRIKGLPDLFECDSNSCSIERLQRAWRLIERTCKGTKSSF